jgi:alanine racemase
MPRPIKAVIHLPALRHNLAVARRHAAGRKLWAVVKANAYGHGIERVLPAFAGADGLALLDLAEAQRARAAGWLKPILLLEGFFLPGDLELVERLQLTTVVHGAAQLEMLERHRAAAPIEVYLKCNTGMNRLGFAADDAPRALARLAALPQVTVRALMTHLANADRNPAADGPVAVAEQLQRFAQIAPQWPGERSVANSAALVGLPAMGDSVRPGIALYGGAPVAGQSAAGFDLRAAMSLRSQVLAVQQIELGAATGYGSRWVARRASRIGVVACGYADGYPRVAPDDTPVAVDGQTAPLIGRVSMDLITIDLTDLPQAGVGSTVELWGAQVPIDSVAERAGTVGYELMCALAPRVPVQVED